jgi:hypothetical protein
MASAQADCGGVSGAAGPAFDASIVAFARDLLSFAAQRHPRLPGQRRFDLPGASLHIGFSTPEYAELCDRSYLSDRAPTNAASKVRLAVLDYESLPGMPRWTGPAPGFYDLPKALAQHGLHGAYDAQYQDWDFYDPARALGVQAMQTTSLRPPWEPSFPLRLLLHWAGRTAERGIIHAGTLGAKGRGVLLVGAGGAGKSGTTLSGILNGLSSVGDDYIAISAIGGAVEARPVLRTMKQDLPGLRRLSLEPGKGALTKPINWQGKIEFDFEALVPGARVDRLAMTALLMPHIGKSPRSLFRRAHAREVMMAMAPSSLFQLPGSWRGDFGLIASIVRALPAFHMDLSEEPAEIASAIRAFIENGAP